MIIKAVLLAAGAIALVQYINVGQVQTHLTDVPVVAPAETPAPSQ